MNRCAIHPTGSFPKNDAFLRTPRRSRSVCYANIDLNSHPTPQAKLLACFFRFFRRKKNECRIPSRRASLALPGRRSRSVCFANIDLNSHTTPQAKLLACFFRIFSEKKYGRGRIRTHEPLAGFPVFKTGAFGHSATLP